MSFCYDQSYDIKATEIMKKRVRSGGRHGADRGPFRSVKKRRAHRQILSNGKKKRVLIELSIRLYKYK